jgi:hypothetical protein
MKICATSKSYCGRCTVCLTDSIRQERLLIFAPCLNSTSVSLPAGSSCLSRLPFSIS